MCGSVRPPLSDNRRVPADALTAFPAWGEAASAAHPPVRIPEAQAPFPSDIVCRSRPDHLRLVKQGGYSFPSGHSMITVCFYGLLMYLIMKKVKNKYLKIVSMIILSIIVITIPISRIYVGVHYPTDVVAGLSLGGIVLILSINCINSVFGGIANEKSSSK